MFITTTVALVVLLIIPEGESNLSVTVTNLCQLACSL